LAAGLGIPLYRSFGLVLALYRLAKVVLRHATYPILRLTNDNVAPRRTSYFRLGAMPPIPSIRLILTLGKLYNISLATIAADTMLYSSVPNSMKIFKKYVLFDD
jgi:hypothetical protein